jgi:hypothetical protein
LYGESHLNKDFKDYCLKHKTLTLCILPHSSHILQQLDVLCFSPLKRKYSQRVRDLAHYGNASSTLTRKASSPPQGRVFNVFTIYKYRKAFEVSGLVPINAQVVLDRLEVQLRTWIVAFVVAMIV